VSSFIGVTKVLAAGSSSILARHQQTVHSEIKS
jgi:hypothetical protein